jgi:predicted transcriptional regulator
MEKDAEVQRSIASREEKIQQLKEKSIRKEDELSTKAKELAELRERTRRMMEKARAKEAEFTENEQKLQQVLSQDPAVKRGLMDKILARANEKAAQLKAEKQAARRLQGEEKGEDNLLAFLRRSHKEGCNIYDYLAPESSSELAIDQPPASSARTRPLVMAEDRDLLETKHASVPNGRERVEEGQVVSRVEEKGLNAVPTPGKVRREGGLSLGTRFMTMYRDLSDTVQTLTSSSGPGRLARGQASTTEQITETAAFSQQQQEDEDSIASAWTTQVEQTIQRLEERTDFHASLTNGHSAAVLDHVEQQQLPRVSSTDSFVHYAERWSLSPPEERQNRTAPPPPPASKLRPLNKPAIIVNGRLRTKQNGPETCNGEVKAARKEGHSSGSASPRYGALVRRKSLSDNCLTAKSQQQRQRSQTMERELDAFGIPRLPPRPRRSVSLMRETFTNRGREEPPQHQQQNVIKQRAISHETRTSSAAEFKNLFEAGSAGNSTRASRSSTPFRPPQVDYKRSVACIP